MYETVDCLSIGLIRRARLWSAPADVCGEVFAGAIGRIKFCNAGYNGAFLRLDAKIAASLGLFGRHASRLLISNRDHLNDRNRTVGQRAMERGDVYRQPAHGYQIISKLLTHEF